MQRINELDGKLDELSKKIVLLTKDNLEEHKKDIIALNKEYDAVEKELRAIVEAKFPEVELWGYEREFFEADFKSNVRDVVKEYNRYIIVDKDLDFLEDCTNDQLKLLCDILTTDLEGNSRITEELTFNERYKENYPQNLKVLLPLIKKEIYMYGGDSFKNFFHEIGISNNNIKYRDILEAVCDRAEVNYNKGNSIALVERYLIQKVCITSIENMAIEDIFHIAEQINKKSFGKVIKSLYVSGPAYRVIVPVVLTIVYLRYKTCGNMELPTIFV